MSSKHEWENLDQFRSKAEIYEDMEKSSSTISDLFDSMSTPASGSGSDATSDRGERDNEEGEKDD